MHETVLGGLDRAIIMSKDAGVILAMGSSLAVSPANSLPLMGEHLVICNLQATDLDQKCNIRIYSDADTFMRFVDEELLNGAERREEHKHTSLSIKDTPQNSSKRKLWDIGESALEGTSASPRRSSRRRRKVVG